MGHNKGVHEVVSRGYTHVAWRAADNVVAMRSIAHFCLALAMTAMLSTADLHVSRKGADTNPGTRDRPFASVQKALDAMQEEETPGTVWLAPGEYVVDNGIALDKIGPEGMGEMSNVE